MHKTLLTAIVGLVIASALLTVAQIWGFGIGWDTYIKLIITLGIAVLVLAFVMIAKADLGDHKKMKDENYLD